ncbi:MAG: Ubiquinone/menaquinone biosynthesis C-methyltransferase UbiE [Anaerolineae bacterium]|nr:Ubiquinone/menaquinone biosynthesis C-methyltransferase UbiE [Anaerolineae bacterium]
MTLDVTTVVAHFASSADRYANTRNLPDQRDFFIKAFQKLSDKHLKILDIGCGTGHRLRGFRLFYPSFDLYGIDITPNMLRSGQATQAGGINLMVGDSLNIPFPNQSFDAIIISEVLHHLVSNDRVESCRLRELALLEILRLVKPGGLILLHEVCFYSLWRSIAIFHLSYLFSRFNFSIPMLNVHKNVVVNFFTLQELERTFKQFNLEILARDFHSYKTIVNWLSGLFAHPVWVKYVLQQTH